jgi:hypothetical protein
MKKAVAAVLLMKAESTATDSMMAGTSNLGLRPAYSRILRPAASTIPVWARPAVMINSPRIIITVSLANPAKA